MDTSWQTYNHRACITGIIFTFLARTCAIGSTVPAATNLTNYPVQPNDLEQNTTCGIVCKYEEWFHRAHCDERGLTYVPSSIGCTDATLLELQENDIQRIPPERIAEYYNVKTLDISWNQLSVIEPGTFLGLNNFKNIICSYNRLERLSDGVLNGTEHSLTRIYFNENKIFTLGNRIFEGLNQVTDIYLNNNRIQVLPLRVFRDLINIKHLTLANNRLRYLDQDQFSGLKNLITLDLQGNRIRMLPEELFAGLDSLKEVHLSDNHLISIPAPQNLGVPLGVEKLNFANNRLNQTAVIFPFLINANWTSYINGNPFLCDCDFQKLQEWLNTTSSTETISISSETPLTCEFNDGAKYNVMSYIPSLCSDTTESSVDTWFDSSMPATAIPVLENQHKQLVSSGTSSDWLSILTFIELTAFIILWLLIRHYKRCKNIRQNVTKA